jgi:outer membrane protein assembly factor BamE (lipoprotein component of BamABCDE complex)
MKLVKFLGRVAGLLVLLGLILAWRDMSGNTINPRYVERIKDGQTTKNEIMVMFGDPQEIKRTENTIAYTYKSFKDAPALPYDPEKRQVSSQSDQLYLLDEEKKIKKAPLKTEGKILKSTLIIYFKPDGQTVSGHEYTEHKN